MYRVYSASECHSPFLPSEIDYVEVMHNINGTLKLHFKDLYEFRVPEKTTWSKEDWYKRIEKTVQNNDTENAGGLNMVHIQRLLTPPNVEQDFSVQGKDRQQLCSKLRLVWHESIQHRHMWSTARLAQLKQKDELVSTWESFLIFVYMPYFETRPEETISPLVYDFIELNYTYDRTAPRFRVSRDRPTGTMEESHLNRSLESLVFTQWDEYMEKVFTLFLETPKTPIQTREKDLAYHQMKYYIDSLEHTAEQKAFTSDDEEMKRAILGYGIGNHDEHIGEDGRLRPSTCFVTGQRSNGVGDHLYPMRNMWKITHRCGSTSQWNLIPVISSINQGYTSICIWHDNKFRCVNLENTEITHIHTNISDTLVGTSSNGESTRVAVENFMKDIDSSQSYSEKKMSIRSVNMREQIEKGVFRKYEGVEFVTPVWLARKQILIPLWIQKKINAITKYKLSDTVDIWMKIYLWRRYVREQNAELSWEIPPEKYNKLLEILREGINIINEGTKKIIDMVEDVSSEDVSSEDESQSSFSP